MLFTIPILMSLFRSVYLSKGCPKVVHSLMLDCWDEDKNKRPKFSEIVRRLDGLIRSPECLKDNSLSLQSRYVLKRYIARM